MYVSSMEYIGPPRPSPEAHLAYLEAKFRQAFDDLLAKRDLSAGADHADDPEADLWTVFLQLFGQVEALARGGLGEAWHSLGRMQDELYALPIGGAAKPDVPHIPPHTSGFKVPRSIELATHRLMFASGPDLMWLKREDDSPEVARDRRLLFLWAWSTGWLRPGPPDTE
jgi:hypothetical protein